MLDMHIVCMGSLAHMHRSRLYAGGITVISICLVTQQSVDPAININCMHACGHRQTWSRAAQAVSELQDNAALAAAAQL